jgi:hypothetical protein
MADYTGFTDWARIAQQSPDINKTIQDGIDRGRANDAYAKAQDALARVRANPNDTQAMTDLAVYNPDAAKAYQNANAVKLATQGRLAAANLWNAQNPVSTNTQSQLAALVTPAPAPVQAPVDTTSAQLPLSNLTPAPSALAPLAPPSGSSSPVLTPAPSGLASLVSPQAATQHAAPVLAPIPSQVSQNIAPPQVQPQAASAPAPTTAPDFARAGAAVMSGQQSVHDATMAVIANIDPKQINEYMTAFDALGKDQKDKMADANNALGHTAFSLLSIPDDANHTARRQFLNAHADELAQHGVTADDIARADLSDNGLHDIVGQALTVEQLYTQKNKERDDARLDAAQVETTRHNHETEGKPVTSPDGTIIDPKTGKIIYSASGTPTNNGGPVSADQVWNSIVTQESGGQAGKIGPMTRWGTAKGATQLLDSTAQQMANKLGVPYRPDLMIAKTQEGLAYQLKLGRAYYDQGLAASNGDPRGAAAYYFGGPSAAMHGPKTDAYVDQVVRRASGSGASTTPSQSAGNVPPPNSSALDYQAEIYRKTGKLPQGSGAIGRAKNDQIMARAAQLAQIAGKTGTDDTNSQADLKNDNATLKTLQTNRGLLITSINNAKANGDLFVSTGQALEYQTGSTNLNSLINGVMPAGTAAGQALAAHRAATQAYLVDCAKIQTTTTGMGGVLSDSARHEYAATLDSNQPMKAKLAAKASLDADNEHRIAGYDKEIADRTYQRDNGHNVAPVHVTSKADVARLPSGTRFAGPDGRVWTKS